MKLYTEEQLKQIVEKSRETGLTAEYLMLTTSAIELPSDEEIEEKLKIFSELIKEPTSIFVEGAKWMREQILNQNK